MATTHFPVKVGATQKQVSCYWAKHPGYSEADALKAWVGGDTPRQRDAVALARLAALKWLETCETGTVVSSVPEMESAIRADPQVEVTAMLLAEARWFEPGLMGVCLFHRTWAGNVFLDFLAAHPEAEGQVLGLGTGLLYNLCDISRRLHVALLWGETAVVSKEFYERAFGVEALSDQLLVSHEHQEAFCRRIESKWPGR